MPTGWQNIALPQENYRKACLLTEANLMRMVVTTQDERPR